MKFSENIFELCKTFLKDAKYVDINYENIFNFTNEIKEKQIFPEPFVGDQYKTILIELVAASINYCYFYGRHDIRPNNSSSTTMYKLLMDSFSEYNFSTKIEFSNAIDEFKKNLCLNRFPLIEERCKHLDELKENAQEFSCNVLFNNSQGIEPLLINLIGLFPGFSSDIFLKRASLFFIQLYRRFGWFEKDLHHLHVPADYQIPKMLKHYELITYSPELQYMINNNVLIQKYSKEECELRAATIITVNELCQLTNWNVAEIDTWFFMKRHDCKDPFHMVITTDY